MKKVSLIFLFASACFGQTYYTAAKNTTLVGTAEVITIQLPAANLRTVRFISLYFDCSVACVITLERSGTTATVTTLAVNPTNLGEIAATTNAMSGSDVGVGTILAKYSCLSSCNTTVDLTGISFKASQTNTANLTARTNSITGTVNIMFKFQEAQ